MRKSEKQSLKSIAKSLVKIEQHFDQITESLDALQTNVYKWIYYQAPHLFDE